MNLIDNFFITPHAIEQFQKRITRLGDERTREVIRAGVSQATNVRVLPDGETLRVRTVKPFPYEFSPVFQRRVESAIKDPRRVATLERRIQPSRRDAA